MSDTTATPDLVAAAPEGGIPPRLRQLAAIARLEVRQTLLRGRSLALYLVVLLPVLVSGVRAFVIGFFGQETTVGATTNDFAGIYRHLGLAAVVFFGCAAVFSNMIRREILERTLHYPFLLPVRREVLLAGKYLGGVVALGSLFSLMAVVTFLLAYLPTGSTAMAGFLFRGPGLGHLASYVGVTLVAVVGYGALFLALGLFFRRPAIPVIAIFGWESINFLLPPLLKRLSVSHYLGSLTPVPVSEGPFALVADAPSPVVAVLGLLALSGLLLAVSGWKLRHIEVLYGED